MGWTGREEAGKKVKKKYISNNTFNTKFLKIIKNKVQSSALDKNFLLKIFYDKYINYNKYDIMTII